MCCAQIGVKDVTVRRGSLLLTPENTVVVGGQVRYDLTCMYGTCSTRSQYLG